MADIRSNWTLAEVREIYNTPLLDLVFRAATVHRAYHDPQKMQLCTLVSVKTGGCSEDCSYCPQSAHYETTVENQTRLTVADVLAAAEQAKEGGASRFCMGAAWRKVRDGKDFNDVLAMVRGVRALDMEACCTLGMLTREQADQLKDAGLTAYNHNIDTSREYYDKIITTRTYDDRLQTLQNVRDAGIGVCTGGILGMGESEHDRVGFLHTLATLDPHPENVPINALVAVEGTPLEDQKPLHPFVIVRAVAVARILMPKAIVRLSAGRLVMSDEAQALAFFAGANSLFTGDKLLTTPNPEFGRDHALLATLGMRPSSSYA